MSFSMARIITPGILLLVFMSSFIGCSSHLPTPNIPEAAGPMIMVNGESLPTISYTKLIADVPGGRITGYHYEGMEYTRGYAHKWDENFNNETGNFNYLAMEILSDAGYRIQADGLGELRLEGIIKKLSYNSYSNKTDFDQVECDLQWDLFRAGEDTPFFTTVTPGAGRVSSNKTGVIKAAFELGLRRLLATETFVAAVGDSRQ